MTNIELSEESVLGTPEYWEEEKKRYIERKTSGGRRLSACARSWLKQLEEKRVRAENSRKALESIKRICAEQALAGNQMDAAFVSLSISNLCARDGIKVVFNGMPSTDGRVIQLGAVDLMNAAAPVYIWGHGLHERNHVVYTDFSVVAKAADELEKDLFNLIEDLRIDMLAWKEMKGYSIWRRALFDVMAASGQRIFKRHKKDDPVKLVLIRWMWLDSIAKRFDVKLPAGLLSNSERTLAKHIGREALERLADLIEARMPPESSEGALKLAREVIELLWSEADRLAEKRVCASIPKELQEEDSVFAAVNLNFEIEDSSDAGEEEKALAAFLDRLDSEKSSSVNGYSFLMEEAVRGVFSAASAVQSESTSLSDEEALRFVVNYAVKAAADDEELERIKSTAAAAGFSLNPMKKDPSAQDRRRDFLEFLKELGHLGPAFSERLKRPLFTGWETSRRGWDFDDEALDRLAVGDDRVMLVEAPEDKRRIACQIVVDRSGSVGDYNLVRFKAVAAKLEEAFKTASNSSAQTCFFPGFMGRTLMPASSWETPCGFVAESLAAVGAMGPTTIVEVLAYSANSLVARPEETKLIFLITDGRFPASDYRRVCGRLEEAGIEVAALRFDVEDSRLEEEKARLRAEDAAQYGEFFERIFSVSELPDAACRLLSKFREKAWMRARSLYR